MSTLKVKLQEGGISPVRATEYSAGYDLYSPIECVVMGNSDLLLKLKVSIQLPPGCYAQIWPRSGLDTKHRITTGAGVIDEDYRGELGVLLRNLSAAPYKIERQERIAQLIVMKYETPQIELTDELNATVRGDGGFGSTGQK